MQKKILIIFTLFFLLFLILPLNFSSAQTNRVDCDLCGFCPSVDPTPPSNWKDCAKCLYPTLYPLTPVPDGRTLELDPTTGEPIPAQKGRYYSFLGCISTDLSSFQEEGAAVSVVQILSRIVFSIVGAVSFVYLLYAAFVLATSQANPEKINYGKYLLKRSIIGLAFSLLAFFIVKLLAVKILELPWFSSP